MKKLLLALTVVFIIVLFSSCRIRTNPCEFELDPGIKAPDGEITMVQNYLTANSITATKHPSGIFYSVVSDGSGNNPTQCNIVGVTYIGTLINGNEFDRSNANFFSQLGKLIYGWRIGLPLIRAGGKIKLYVPPSFGYGQEDQRNENGVIIIPKNSVLIFEVNLNEVKE